MREEILTLARIVSGAGETEEALLESLCQAARLRWEGRLRQGLTPAVCVRALAGPAASRGAAYRTAGGGGGAFSAFRGGDLSIKGRGAAEAASLAQGLRRTAEGLMAPYVETEDFCFKGVRG